MKTPRTSKAQKDAAVRLAELACEADGLLSAIGPVHEGPYHVARHAIATLAEQTEDLRVATLMLNDDREELEADPTAITQQNLDEMCEGFDRPPKVVKTVFVEPEPPRPSFDDALATWLERATDVANVSRQPGQTFENLPRVILEVMRGRRYCRIVRTEEGTDHHRSAYCFLDTTNGDVLKPDGWKGPTKHARGNIYTDRLGVGEYGAHCLR